MHQKAVVSILRVSSKRQMEGEGIPTQRQGVELYCEREHLTIAKEFVIAESGSLPNEQRTNMEEAIAWCIKHRKQIAAVVIWKVDRFSRGGVFEYYKLKERLLANGIVLRSATETIDDTPDGEFNEGSRAVHARYDNRIRTVRTIGAEISMTQQGYWCRPAPTGFTNAHIAIGVSDNGRKVTRPVLAPVPDAKQWSLLCYGLRKQLTGCYKISEIVRELRQKGMKTRTGKPMNAATWTKMCRSPVYGGLLCEKWTNNQYVRAKFDGAITADEWHQLQRVLDMKGKQLLKLPRQKQNPLFPLRRFLRCSCCQAPLCGSASTGKMKKKYGYYDCKTCGYRVASETAHTAYREKLADITPSDELMTLFTAIVSDAWDEEVHRLKESLQTPQENLASLQKKQQDILALMKQCADTPDIVDQLKSDYKLVQQDIAQASQPQEVPELLKYDRDTVLAYCRYFLKHASELWEEALVEDQNRYQAMTFPNGVSLVSLELKRTPGLSPIYETIELLKNSETTLAAPRRIELRLTD